MSVNGIVQPAVVQNAAWQPVGADVHMIPPPVTGRQHAAREDLKARNRIAAKKWRDRKDEMLAGLEMANDTLRRDALSLRNEVLALQTENQVLEDELRFFQAFMTKIMNVAPKQGQGEEKKKKTENA